MTWAVIGGLTALAVVAIARHLEANRLITRIGDWLTDNDIL